MSNLKRFLAMTLVMVMMISALATTASARFFDDVQALKDSDLSAAIDLLSEMGIAKGVSPESFDPESPVTRQQFALFVARIHSATPEFFVASTSKSDVPPFSDVVDNTYFMAVNYCYENQIINGTVEPTTEKDGIFAPESGIIFQDAIKMLVSALGYAKSGLAYPVGYLAKAKEIGLLEGFGLGKIKANDTVTRANMAALLYNYFLNDYIEVQMVWNPVQNQYVANQIKTAVCSKFGITKIEGYVTAIEGAAIPMEVEDTYSTKDMATVTFKAEPINMKMADPKTAGHYNLVISYLTNEFEKVTSSGYNVPVYTTIGGATVAGYIEVQGTTAEARKLANFKTTKAALGLEEDYKDLVGSRELLGCKVVAFVNTTNKAITLPKTRVVGVKTRVEKPETDVTWNPEDNDTSRVTRINSITLDGVVFNQRDPADLTGRNGYVFIGNGESIARPVNSASPVANATSLNYLAGMIKRTGAITVDYIDNGVNMDGTPNNFIIFTPYEAVYVNADNASNVTKEDSFEVTLGNGNTLKLFKSSSLTKYVDATTFKDNGIAKDSAYFISRQGEYVLNYGKLVQLAEGSVSYVDADRVSFTRSTTYGYAYADLTVRYNYRNVFYQALNNRLNLGGTYTGLGTGTTNAYAIGQHDNYKVFAPSSVDPNYGYVGEDSRVFFIYKTGTTSVDTSKHFAYVLSETGASSVQSNGTVLTTYTVYDLNTKTQKQLLDVNSSISQYKRGDHIAYYVQGTNTHRIIGYARPCDIEAEWIEPSAYITPLRDDLIAKTNRLGIMTGAGQRASGTIIGDDYITLKNLLGANSTSDIDLGVAINRKLGSDLLAWETWMPWNLHPWIVDGIVWTDLLALRGAAWSNLSGITWVDYAGTNYNAYEYFNSVSDTEIAAVIKALNDKLEEITTGTKANINISQLNGYINTLRGEAQKLYNALYVTNNVVGGRSLTDLLKVIERDVEKRIEENQLNPGSAWGGEKLANDYALKIAQMMVENFKNIYNQVLEIIKSAQTAVDALENYQYGYLDVWNVDEALNAINSGTNRNQILENNEYGWMRVNTWNGILGDGFTYTPVATVTNNIATVGSATPMSTTVTANSLICIYDWNTKLRVNAITRTQLDALIYALESIGGSAAQRTIKSAVAIRESYSAQGACKALWLGLDTSISSTAAIVSQYLNIATNTTRYLVVTEVVSDKVLVDGVWYAHVKAYDYAGGSVNEEIFVSSTGTLYNNIKVGDIIILSSSETKSYNGKTYRVGQLKWDYENIITTSYINDMINNSSVYNTHRVFGGSFTAGQNVTTVDGKVHTLKGTAPVMFINLEVTRNSAGTIIAISQTHDEYTLNTGLGSADQASRSSTYTLKAKDWNWSRFGTMAQPSSSITGWYVVPAANVESGVVVIYISSVK